MAFKALLTWDVRIGSEKDHFSHVREFVGKLPALGMELEDAWYAVYGNVPQILLVIGGRDKVGEQLYHMTNSAAWEELLNELRPYITDYRQRIVEGNEHFYI